MANVEMVLTSKAATDFFVFYFVPHLSSYLPLYLLALSSLVHCRKECPFVLYLYSLFPTASFSVSFRFYLRGYSTITSRCCENSDNGGSLTVTVTSLKSNKPKITKTAGQNFETFSYTRGFCSPKT